MKNNSITKLLLASLLLPLTCYGEIIKIGDTKDFDLKANKGIFEIQNSKDENSISFDDEFKDYVQAKNQSGKINISVSDKLIERTPTFKINLKESSIENCSFLLYAGTISTTALCQAKNKYTLYAGNMDIQTPESKLGSLFVKVKAGSADIKGLTNKSRLIDVKTNSGSINVSGPKDTTAFSSYGIGAHYQQNGKEETPTLEATLMAGMFDGDFGFTK